MISTVQTERNAHDLKAEKHYRKDGEHGKEFRKAEGHSGHYESN